MTIDYNAHSVWLSASPIITNEYDDLEYRIPEDKEFFYIGGQTNFSYSNSYNATVMGVYSQQQSDAYFIDSQNGSVSQISISAIRNNPGVDSVHAQDYNNCSNAKVIELLRNMRQSIQLNQGAYVLRIYNGTQNLRSSGVPYDIPVFLNTYQISHNFENPNIISISLQFIRRCPLQHINIGETQRDST